MVYHDRYKKREEFEQQELTQTLPIKYLGKLFRFIQGFRENYSLVQNPHTYTDFRVLADVYSSSMQLGTRLEDVAEIKIGEDSLELRLLKVSGLTDIPRLHDFIVMANNKITPNSVVAIKSSSENF